MLTPDVNQPAIIGEAVAGQNAQHAATILTELNRLNTLVNDSTFDIAELLVEVKENRYYTMLKYETFDEYVEIVLGMKRVKAYYLIKIVTTAKKLGIERKDYEDAPISKLREIFTLAPFDKEGNELHSPITGEKISDHIKELVSKAGATPLKDIVESVSKIKGEVGEQEMVFIPAIKVTKNCRDNVILPARELARKKLGDASIDADGDPQEYSDSACEECIHADFLADPNNADQPLDAVSQQVQDVDFPEMEELRALQAEDPDEVELPSTGVEKIPFDQAHKQFLEDHEVNTKQSTKGTKI